MKLMSHKDNEEVYRKAPDKKKWKHDKDREDWRSYLSSLVNQAYWQTVIQGIIAFTLFAILLMLSLYLF